MTPKKKEISLPVRTPAYVDRAIGAAELGISPATFDRYVDQDILPKPVPGFPLPRWRWADIEAKLTGQATAGVDRMVEVAARFKNAKSKN